MDDVPTRYPAVRNVLASPYAELSDEALESVTPRLFGGLTAPDAENWLSAIGSGLGAFASQAAQAVSSPQGQRILSAAGGGAAAGSAAGPWGALIGAGLGAATAALAPQPTAPRPAAAPARGRGPAPATASSAAGTAAVTWSPQPAAPPAHGTPAPAPQLHPASEPPPLPAYHPGPASAGGAGNALLSVLARPETQHALIQLALGAAGKEKVSTGGFAVPAAAFANLLGGLATQASAEFAESHPEAAEADDTYVAFQPSADPANPLDRAASLNALLSSLPPLSAPGSTQEPVVAADPVGSASDVPPKPSEPRRERPRRRVRRSADRVVYSDAETAELEAAAWYEYLRTVSS
ncbi:hypothetical protein [Streptomyces sp. NPDC093568]|uniref:hypothetical protein n=1 Tax=Streptomyces sp. NPDC093568 TaxID=3366041 RepID=UPI0037F845B6